eukprot:jgi/Undpi1/3393/HiC_scaffold_15.g06766.m1
MVSRLAVLVLGMAPAAVAAGASAAKSLLRGSAPESVMGFSRRGPLLTRGLAEEDQNGGTYEHVGCYLDSEEDRILGSSIMSLEMTTMACHTHCDALGSAYMATQNGSECWCSKDGLLDFQRHGDGVGKCDSYCGGDKMQTCGGDNAFDLYRMEWAPASDSPEYKGCYLDMENERLMDDMMEAEMMTPVLCREHCMGKGVATYATQFGNECWCGTSADMEDYSKHGEGVCHMRCSGDNEIACGGYNSLSVFQMDDMEDGPTPAPSTDTEATDRVDQPTAEPSSDEQQPTAVDQTAMDPAASPSMDGQLAAYGQPTMDSTMMASNSGGQLSDYDQPTMGYPTSSSMGGQPSDYDQPTAGSPRTSSMEEQPTAVDQPTMDPTMSPVAEPTAEPSMAPVAEPTAVDQPTMDSPMAPVAEPTALDQPTMGSPVAPVAEPTAVDQPIMGSPMAPVAEPTAVDQPTMGSPMAPVAEPTAVDQPTMGSPMAPVAEPTAVDQPTMGSPMAPVAEPTSVDQPTMGSPMAPAAEPTAVDQPTMGSPMAPAAEPTSVDQPTMGSPMAPAAEPTSVDQPTMGSPMAPAAEPTAEDPETQPTEGGGDAGDYEELLAIHNRKRCMHGASPLQWDSTIQKVAQAYAEFLTNSDDRGTIFDSKQCHYTAPLNPASIPSFVLSSCSLVLVLLPISFSQDYADVLTNSDNCGTISHSDNPYGENLYYCGHSSGYTCYSNEEAMTALFDSELTDNVETWGLHATAIAWKSTTKIGCAVSNCKGEYYTQTLVCNFDPPGNDMSRVKEEVELESKSKAECS